MADPETSWIELAAQVQQLTHFLSIGVLLSYTVAS